MHAIERMRAHPVYVQFERRWQLPVYFQLRWKEIVTKLEEALATTKLERNKGAYMLSPSPSSKCKLISSSSSCTICHATGGGNLQCC